MTFLGMNTDEVSGHVQRLMTDQERLEALAEALDATVSRSADFWTGPDADAYRSSWQVASHNIHSASQDLASRRSELAQQVEQQTVTSAADAGGGDTTPSGTSAHDGPNAPGEEAYYGEVDPEVAERWSSLSKDDREAVAQAILDEQLERYGIDPVTIDFDLLDANGRWSYTTEGGHTIEINGSVLSTPRLLHTIAHEARHAAQFEAVQDTEPGALDWLPWVESTDDDYERLEDEHGFTREEIDSWREHWNTPVEERGPYLDQSVEVDARNAGAEFSEGLTMDDLDRYEEEAGVG